MIPGVRVLLAFFVTLTLASVASGAGPMDAYVADVVRNNPSLTARALQRSAFSREQSASGLWPDPNVQVMLDNLGGREPQTPMARYQLSQMIPWPGKLALMQAAAAERVNSAAASWKTRRLDLELEAKRAYLMLVLNSRRLEVNRANRALAKTVADTALARYSAGAVGHHDVARAQVEVNAVDAERIVLTGERISITAMLNALRNAPFDRTVPEGRASEVAPRLPPYARSIERGVAQRPELDAMRAMQQEEQAMARLAARERYPDLMTGVWYNQMLTMPGDSVGLMVGATIPVFGVRRQNRLGAAARLRGQSVAQDAAAMRAMIRFEVVDGARKVDTARQTLAFIRDAAEPRARQSFLASLSAYSTGTLEIAGLLDAWRALQSVSLARAEASVAVAAALAEFERATGASLETSR